MLVATAEPLVEVQMASAGVTVATRFPGLVPTVADEIDVHELTSVTVTE